MLLRRLLLLLLPLGLIAAPAPAQNLDSASGYTVRGTVLNEATEQPVARALVILGNEQAMLTGGDGTFSFDNIAAGTYSLSIRKPGYGGLGGGGRSMMTPRPGGDSAVIYQPPSEVRVGPEMPDLTYRILPLAGISGHLTLSTADPADAMRISVYRRALEDGHPRWSMAAMARTRSDGSWRVADLAPGRYLVLTSAAIDGPADAGNSQVPVFGFPALYYPGVTDIGSAGVLVLRAGQQAQADMTLVRQRFYPVTIAVRGMPDTPTSLEITDSGGRATGLPVRLDRQTQLAHANVPNGTWSLIAHAFASTMQYGRTDFQVAGAPASLAISVAPIPAIPVIIHRDFTAADGSLPSSSSGPGMSLFLASADDFASGGGGITPVQSQQDGDAAGYEVRIFQPGRFWVQTADYGPTYVASVTSGGTDLANTPLTVVPGSPPAPIEVTLRNDPGTIDGQLDTGAPGGGAGITPRAWIYAIPLFPTTGHVPEASLQSNGQFSMENLPPGSYRVIACDAPQEIDFHSQEGLSAWTGKGKVVTVEAGGTANVELSLLHQDASE